MPSRSVKWSTPSRRIRRPVPSIPCRRPCWVPGQAPADEHLVALLDQRHHLDREVGDGGERRLEVGADLGRAVAVAVREALVRLSVHSVLIASASWRLSCSKDQRMVSALVLGAEPVPAVELEALGGELLAALLREPRQDGLQRLLLGDAGVERLLAAQARRRSSAPRGGSRRATGTRRPGSPGWRSACRPPSRRARRRASRGRARRGRRRPWRSGRRAPPPGSRRPRRGRARPAAGGAPRARPTRR